jgi:peroxiredoxin
VEAPHLQKVQQSVKGKGGMVLGIALQGDTVETIKQFRVRNKVNYPVAIDTHNKFGPFIEAIPITVLVDRKGIIQEASSSFDAKANAWLKARYLKLLSGK